MNFKSILPGLGLGMIASCLLGPVASKAGVVYNLYQQGNDVVLEGAGAFLTLPSSVGTLGPCSTGIYPNTAGTCTGVFGPSQNVYNIISGSPTSWSSIGFTAASSSIGNPLSLNASTGQVQFDSSYTLGSLISSSAIFNNKTLADLGITSFGTLGIYTLAGTNETIVVKATPGPLPLLGAGATFGMSRRLRRRIQLGRPGMKS